MTVFVGAVPLPAVEQITRAVPFDEWRNVYVGCSGSFRFDRAVKQRYPGVAVHSNDISLLSCSLGALATGKEFAITFKGRLAFMQEALEGMPFVSRVAAVQVALEMAKFKSTSNEYARSHFAHYEQRFLDFLKPAQERTEKYFDGLEIASFFAGDFRKQAEFAAAAGGGVASFAPTYKSGYERLYRFLDDNTDWERPAYDIWDPAKLEDWIDKLDDTKVRYCVLTDHLLDHHEPLTVYRSQTNKPIYTFSDKGRASVRRAGHKNETFRYRPVDPDALTSKSKVEIVNATSGQMNFLKDIYLQKGIAHVSGLANFLVFVDGTLAGGFIYARERYHSDGIYMLSDFSIIPGTRISKLVAMLATSRVIIERMEIKLGQRIKRVTTTAFTKKPVSMKYRGIFEMTARKEGMLNYASAVRQQTPEQIYAEWFERFVASNRHPSGGAIKGAAE